jgi:hypothetical protein
VVALSGCADSHSLRYSSLTDSNRRQIYDRVGATFTNAIIFKPLDTSPADALGFAPLIIQEVATKNVARWSANSGTAHSSDQIPSLPGVTTTIYFQRTQMWLHGRPHDQVMYFWRHPDWTPRTVDPELRIQGVRITLDSVQQPVIWEIARDTSRAEIIYVSHSLERLAAEEFDGPLPGRRFAVERGLREPSGTIVAGVVNSTPVPMGPMVYIQAATKNIGTIACRCAPAPTDKFIGQGYYALSTNLDTRPHGLSIQGRLEERLRLPKDF